MTPTAPPGKRAQRCFAFGPPDPDADLTGSTLIDDDLTPDTRYAVDLCDQTGSTLASASFRTAPGAGASPERYSVALLSCHEPFDANGNVRPDAEEMLEAACRAFDRHEVRQVILGGDQLYSDFPRKLSLFDAAHFRRIAPPNRETILDCSVQEVRRIFHRRYRHFWNLEGWRKLLAHYPCYPIMDDHDIVDNWGSDPAHQDRRWLAFREGAFRAYSDYQGSLIRQPSRDLPDSFDHEHEFADSATFVMDLRSARRAGDDARIFSKEQLARFRRFLHTQRNKRVLFVVLSVPCVHLPESLSRLGALITPDGEDFSDRWSTRGHVQDRDRLLGVLHDHQKAHPEQRIVLLSGDIHIGCVHQMRWQDNPPNLYQFISSGITHDAGWLVQFASSLLMRTRRRLKFESGCRAQLQLVRGERAARGNPCGRLNVGIVELTRSHVGTGLDMRFLLYTHRGSKPLCQYRSPLIDTHAR